MNDRRRHDESSAPAAQRSRSAATGDSASLPGSPGGRGGAPAPTVLVPPTLPRGGGAIRGMGEKFAANAATGTASFTIPIPTSPGRGGFQPSLELRYDSGAGNGAFGIGWALSIPSIARKTDKGLPRYAGASDVFLLSGAEDLVPCRAAQGAGDGLDAFDRGDHRVERYRPRTEGLFARIERWTHRTSGDAHWRVLTRDNVLQIYGRDPSARIADPRRPACVFSWLLDETRDDRGNIARYTYKAEDAAGVERTRASEAGRFEPAQDGESRFLATAQRYLKRIQYGNRKPVIDRAAPAPAHDGDWHFEVVFDYGEHEESEPTPAEARPWALRRDPFSTFRSTFEVRTYRLCRRVLVFHRFAELGPAPCLVRSTDLAYDPGPVVTYLVSATQAGYRRPAAGPGYERLALPPLELTYCRPELHDQVRAIDPTSLEGIPSAIGGGAASWVDLDGEGLSGVLVTGEGTWFYKRNLGGGTLAAPALERRLPCPADLRDGAAHLGDLEGDGTLDLVRYAPPLPGYFARIPDQGFAPFVPLRAVPEIDWGDPDLRFVDLDGDGIADLLLGEQGAFVWHRSLARRGFEPAARVTCSSDEDEGPATAFANSTECIQLADMSGDGLADIVRVRPGEVCYWPNLGYGRFGRKITLDGSPRFDTPDRFDPRRVRFADVDGSGTSDLLYLGRDGVQLHFNQSGNGLSAPRTITTLPPVDSLSQLGVVDLLGRGTPCLVWSSPDGGSRARSILYVDLMGGRKPHLLESMANNLGAETRITYAPSTKFYLQDRAAGRPWLTRLAFPVHVIERIERLDHVTRTRLVTRFAYHHGHFDGIEREFRGFACVEQWDAEDLAGAPLHLPPVRTVTWFHTGAWLDRERLEVALARDYYGSDPANQDPRAAEFFLPDTVVEIPASAGGAATPLSLREEREAVRALRGSVLRQEVYGDDGTDEARHPYTVCERNHQVRRLQRAVGDHPGVFFTHPLHTVTLHYERRPLDPRLQHEVVLEVDDSGNVTRTAALGYPRRLPQEPEQARLMGTVTAHRFANRTGDEDWYRIGVAVESITYELSGVAAPVRGLLDAADLVAWATTAEEIPYESAPTAGVQRRAVDHQRHYYYRDLPSAGDYWADASGPLPLGEITERAVAHSSLRKAFTAGLIEQVYGDRVTGVVLATEGRYRQLDGAWWAPSGREVPDPANFFLPQGEVDPFGERHILLRDGHGLLVLESTDPLGNRITCGIRHTAGSLVAGGLDYRALVPTTICDPNRSVTRVELDALGMVVKLWQMGRQEADEGDDLANPGVEFRYQLDAWRHGRPAFAHTATREQHRAGGAAFDDDGAPRRAGFQHHRTHSDGFGREVMTKVQAEPGEVPARTPDRKLVKNADGSIAVRFEADRWVGTGRTLFDNKGNPVKKYEPFFTDTLDYEDDEELVQWGVTPVLRYDPLERLVRTDHPDGTHSRVQFDAWRMETWDRNDTVLESEWFRRALQPAGDPRSKATERAARLTAGHANTPAVAHLDALARAFLVVADNGRDDTGAERKYRTRSDHDIRGNLLAVTDARGNRVLAQVRDLLGRRVHSISTDAGESRTLLDAGDKPIRSWEPRGAAIRRQHDALQRTTHLFVQLGAAPERLVERVVFGESHVEAEHRQLRTRVYQGYDGAGAATCARYDFKGNLVESVRRLARQYRERPDWTSLAALEQAADIEAAAGGLLEAKELVTTAEYDALSRSRSRVTPDGSETRYAYNEAAMLESIAVRARGATPVPFVESVAYNARGQRLSIRFGNRTTTGYEYDPATFRLVRQVTVRDDESVVQDLEHTHDPMGNVVAVADAVSFGNPGVSANALHEYDPVYQLVRAEGREYPGQQPANDEVARLGLPPAAHAHDWSALGRYRETYDYDATGNLTRMSHRFQSAAEEHGWTRGYRYAEGSNRLQATTLPGDGPGIFTARYEHDAAGNLTRMPHFEAAEWDHANHLQHVRKQVQAAEGAPNDVYFAYDNSGQRVRKIYEHGRLLEERVYLGGYEIFRSRNTATGEVMLERETLHVMDGRHRLALVETTTQESGVASVSPVTRLRFQLDDHLGSSSAELDGAGAVITCEEFTPFGASALRAEGDSIGSSRRYRYTGHERDEETGLYCQGARLHAPWLGRWTSCDPDELADGPNVYCFVGNNPTSHVDPSGRGRESFESGERGEHRVQALDQAVSDRSGEHHKRMPSGKTPLKGSDQKWYKPDFVGKGLEHKNISRPENYLLQSGEVNQGRVDGFVRRTLARSNVRGGALDQAERVLITVEDQKNPAAAKKVAEAFRDSLKRALQGDVAKGTPPEFPAAARSHVKAGAVTTASRIEQVTQKIASSPAKVAPQPAAAPAPSVSAAASTEARATVRGVAGAAAEGRVAPAPVSSTTGLRPGLGAKLLAGAGLFVGTMGASNEGEAGFAVMLAVGATMSPALATALTIAGGAILAVAVGEALMEATAQFLLAAPVVGVLGI